MNCTWDDVSNTTNGKINNIRFYKSCIEDHRRSFYLLVSPPAPSNELNAQIQEEITETIGICSWSNCSLQSLNSTIGRKFEVLNKTLGDVEIFDIKEILEKTKMDFYGDMFLMAVSILILLGIVSTCLNKNQRTKTIAYLINKTYRQEGKIEAKKIIKEVDRRFKYSLWSQFDLRKNYQKITTRKLKSPIAQAFDLIRITAMVFVLAGHEFIVRLSYVTSYKDKDQSYFDYVKNSVCLGIIQNGIHAVSIFFFMGGFASAYVVLIYKEKFEKKKSRSCLSFWAFLVAKRLFRLSPPIMIMVLFYLKIVPLLINGPGIFQYTLRNQFSLLAFYNTVALTGWTASYGGSLLAPWLWYLQTDTHMYLLVPLVLYCCKSKRSAIWCFVAMIIISFLVSCLAFMYLGVQFGTNGFILVYVQPLYRARVYYLGCIFGVVSFWKNKDRELVQAEETELLKDSGIGGQESKLKNYKKISKKKNYSSLNSETKSTKFDIASVMVSICSITAIFNWYHKNFQVPRKMDNTALETTAYVVLAPMILIPSIVVLFIKILSISKPLLCYVQSCKVIQILANLSFSMYLYHYAIIILKNFNHESYYSFYLYDIFASFCCDFLIITTIGFLSCLLIEIPLSNCWKNYFEEWYFAPEKIEKESKLTLEEE